MITTVGIRATGLYLLDVLKSERAVTYSRFYNRDPETELMLVDGAMPFVSEPESHTSEDLQELGHVMLDYAAWQLADLGIVQIKFLQSQLIDGEPDFEIALTEKGKLLADAGLKFGFRDPEYSIDGSSASIWLIEMLRTKPDIDMSLEEVMEAASANDIVVLDNYGNQYELGTGSFAWAFEVALWHHARGGVILPSASPNNGTLWSEFVNSAGRPACPSVFDSHPVWKLRFRLADTSRQDVGHVGRIS